MQHLHHFTHSVSQHTCSARPAVLDDLLHAFSGLDGRYVRAALEEGRGGARVAYALHGCPDAALHELTARMLPLWWA